MWRKLTTNRGDRLFATDIVENEVEELRLDLEGNEAERKEWREWRRQGVQAAQAEVCARLSPF